MRHDESPAEAGQAGIEHARLDRWLASADRRCSDASRPAGLRLTFEGGSFWIKVSDHEGADLVSLGPYPESEVIAIWRALAAASGLPLLVSGPDGTLHRPYPQIGRLVLGERPDRRRLKILGGRRPRFLTRRKPGAFPRRPLVHRERELAGGRAD